MPARAEHLDAGCIFQGASGLWNDLVGRLDFFFWGGEVNDGERCQRMSLSQLFCWYLHSICGTRYQTGRLIEYTINSIKKTSVRAKGRRVVT